MPCHRAQWSLPDLRTEELPHRQKSLLITCVTAISSFSSIFSQIMSNPHLSRFSHFPTENLPFLLKTALRRSSPMMMEVQLSPKVEVTAFLFWESVKDR